MLLLGVSFGEINYIILFVYLTAMVGIGIFFSGRQQSTEDYFLAGRNMPSLVVAMSMFASLTSAASYMGIPGTAYKENVSLFVVGLMSPVVVPILILVIYPFYHSLRVTTSYEYVLHRYGSTARSTVSGLFVLARLGWLGVVLYALAMMLSVVTSINLYLAIVLMGVLATTYTILGGLSAFLRTDVVQFVILILGAVWVAISLCLAVPGGASGVIDIASHSGHLQVGGWLLNWYEMTGFAVALSCFFQLLQDYGTDQVTVQRLMAVRTRAGIARAIMFNGMSDLFTVGLLLFIGLGLHAYFSTFPEKLAEGISPDQALPYYIVHDLPTGVSGLLVAAIFAAAMSSMDSGINSVATVLVNDFVRPLRKKQQTDLLGMSLARWLTFILGFFATGTAFYVSRIEHVFKASSSLLGLFAGPILALFLMGMLTRRANCRGWFCGALRFLASDALATACHCSSLHLLFPILFWDLRNYWLHGKCSHWHHGRSATCI